MVLWIESFILAWHWNVLPGGSKISIIQTFCIPPLWCLHQFFFDRFFVILLFLYACINKGFISYKNRFNRELVYNNRSQEKMRNYIHIAKNMIICDMDSTLLLLNLFFDPFPPQLSWFLNKAKIWYYLLNSYFCCTFTNLNIRPINISSGHRLSSIFVS